jgi:hypothetical protein
MAGWVAVVWVWLVTLAYLWANGAYFQAKFEVFSRFLGIAS